MNREDEIIRYLQDEMGKKEMYLFESELESDESLAEAVEEIQKKQKYDERRAPVTQPKDALEMAHDDFIKGFVTQDMGSKESWRKISAWFIVIMAFLILLGYYLKK
ncbi:MAG: hypothetical protein V3V00_14810 [Saprospiraceae bacterium]